MAAPGHPWKNLETGFNGCQDRQRNNTPSGPVGSIRNAREKDFASKLRLTAAALGCTSRKELCARFRAVNPATHFDLERSHKWLQGRALPRSGQIYDDWSKTIGTSHPGAWIAGCTVEDLRGELCHLFGISSDVLNRAAERLAPASHEGGPVGAADRGLAYLAGSYASYSYAWSPYYQGRLIRAALRIQPSHDGSFAATYREAVAGIETSYAGGIQVAVRTLHLILRHAESGLPAFFSLFMPGPPASATCGIFSGATYLSPEPRPTACRVVFIRVSDGRRLDHTNRYLPTGDYAIAEDLAALGLELPASRRAGDLITGILAGSTRDGLKQVTAGEQASLTAEFDRAYLEA